MGRVRSTWQGRLLAGAALTQAIAALWFLVRCNGDPRVADASLETGRVVAARLLGWEPPNPLQEGLERASWWGRRDVCPRKTVWYLFDGPVGQARWNRIPLGTQWAIQSCLEREREAELRELIRVLREFESREEELNATLGATRRGRRAAEIRGELLQLWDDRRRALAARRSH